MKRIHRDVYIGIIIIIASILLYSMTGSMPKGSAQFPKIILTTFGLFGLGITLAGIKKNKSQEVEEEDPENSLANIKAPMISLLIVIAYVILINFLGFFVSTSLFTISFMLFYKIKSIKSIAFTVIAVDLFIYLLFVLQLNVSLPAGILF